MARKPPITVHLKAAGFIDNRMLTAEADIEAPEGVHIKKMFSLADKSGRIPPKMIKKIFSSPRPPTVLVNGTSIEVPKELKTVLNHGDEVAVMTPLGGG